MTNKPIKSYRAGNLQAAIWFNERQVKDAIVGFKTASLRRSWKDKDKDIWREETLNLRKQDLPKLAVLLAKLQEDLFLNEEEEDNE
ncbi:MAG TPA: hypothetical protein VFE88_04470 [Candidatus Nanoarchaeia archaeon]|nr:hypothetical protein [Candidatus Nanoarchaeia archaeon]